MTRHLCALLAALCLCPLAALADDSATAVPPPPAPDAATAPAAPTDATPAAEPAAPVPAKPTPDDNADPTRWAINSSKSLRANLAAWASRAGWKLDWRVADPYQADSAEPLIGQFPEVLAVVADASRLNICAHRRTKRIVVTEPRVSCKDKD